MYQRRIMENKFNRHITNKQLQYKKPLAYANGFTVYRLRY